jgi:hypothetical protein
VYHSLLENTQRCLSVYKAGAFFNSECSQIMNVNSKMCGLPNTLQRV